MRNKPLIFASAFGNNESKNKRKAVQKERFWTKKKQ
jgi:hypothetical protein